jgi:two-component system, NtrC family, sensor kinase
MTEKATILVVDDTPENVLLLDALLTGKGYRVVTASSGAEALRLIGSAPPDLVLLDVVMPGMGGYEVCQKIRSDPDTEILPVVMVTALDPAQERIKGLEAGADDFLSKPFDRDELRVRLREGERIIQLERTLAEQNRALREAQAALVQTEKLASLGQLAAGLAHEINNPVAYVSNNLAVLQRDVLAALGLLDRYRAGRAALASVEPALAAEAARLEEEIDLAFVQENLPRLFTRTLDGLQRVRDIVRNLRDFARLDEAEFKEADLNAALRSTAEILRHELKERQVRLETDFGDVPPVLCHPGKVNQVFLNVLMNAVQACGPGGAVTVRTRPVPGGGVEVEVADNGSGIKPEHLPHIFEPFFTTKPVGQGTGLGLSVSYGIVRDHGGTIAAESTLGRGTVFRIRLPRRPPGQRSEVSGQKSEVGSQGPDRLPSDR